MRNRFLLLGAEASIEEFFRDRFVRSDVVPVGGLLQDVTQDRFPGGLGDAGGHHDAGFGCRGHGERVGDSLIGLAAELHVDIGEGEYGLEDPGFPCFAVFL